MQDQNPTCPIHEGIYLQQRPTKCGPVWRCPITGCTVRWWGAKDTTPCDYQTAQARKAAHAVIDPIWQRYHMSRASLYRRMKRDLGVEHIGLCDIATCEKIIEWAKKL
ncbi:MAG: zinc-finger-containing protein [Phycisphaerae bacterium]|nr:zinc-finger-containing protein [Phycisphaerae bacterium]